MATDDAEFFLSLATLNLRRGEEEAALAALESALGRSPSAEQTARIRVMSEGIHKATSNAALRSRVEALKRAAPDAPRAKAAPVPSARSLDSASDPSIEIARRLLVSPEVIERLRALVGPARDPTEGPIALPVAEVVGALLSCDLDVRRAADIALDLVVRATGARHGFLILTGAQGATFGLPGGPSVPPEASEAIVEHVLNTGKALVLDDASRDPRSIERTSIRAIGAGSVLAVPLLPQETGRPDGVLYLDAPGVTGAFPPRALELVEAVAAAVSGPLRNARRFEQQGLELARVRNAYAQARHSLGATEPALLCESPAMRELDRLLDRIARGVHTILIEGESGTGKELVARSIHARSERASGPFVAESVAALSPSLVEAELFGHAKGAFTGAVKSRGGLFQVASGGTLFLDEVGEMSDEVQAKLLRVLQEREVRPIGATATVRVDVRVLAATHRDLRALVQEGKFRQDLYYRLGVVVARVPPLRERREDIPLLFRHFLEQAARAHGLPAPEVSEEAQARLLAHSWPGNVRELQAHATRFFLTGADPDPRPEGPTGLEGPLSIRLDLARTVPLLSLHDARQVFDRLYVGRVIELHDGNVTAAATTLGLNRSYLFELVKRLGLRTGKP